MDVAQDSREVDMYPALRRQAPGSLLPPRLAFRKRGVSFAPVSSSSPSDAPGTTSTGLEAPQRSAFVTTHWSVVVSAGRSDTTRARDALGKLCQTYWLPLYAYVRRAGHSPADAQDLTQEFFGRLLERHTLAQADPERGRFRSFLLASLKHFLINEWEKGRARKRGGRARMIPLQLGTAETRCAQLAAPDDTPDRAYDRQWALALLETVLDRLRQEYVDAGREDLFAGLKDTLAGGRAEIPYRDLGAQLGMSEGAVKVAAHRLRRRYRELLREEIANTVAGPEQVEEELRQLFAALSR
jgi:RNA polymerase sigma factor (sigma-70 family)